MSRSLNRFLAGCGGTLLGVALGVAVPSGSEPGSIAGTVRNAKGEAVSGVTIEAASPILPEHQRTSTTDHDGRYRIVALTEGTYRLTFTVLQPHDPTTLLGNVHCATRDDVAVTTGKQTRVDVVLEFCREYTVTIIE
jgi:hypothetical protein